MIYYLLGTIIALIIIIKSVSRTSHILNHYYAKDDVLSSLNLTIGMLCSRSSLSGEIEGLLDVHSGYINGKIVNLTSSTLIGVLITDSVIYLSDDLYEEIHGSLVDEYIRMESD